MVNRTHLAFKANDRSYFAILKKEIHAVAVSAGFSGSKVGEIDIVVAEIVSNLVKHAQGGQILVKLIEQNSIQGIELISVDGGPGMTDITRMVADGVSTKKTLGQGLGAMKRLSDVFQVYSLKEWGTIILLRLFEKPIPSSQNQPKTDVKSVVIPKSGEEKCGDGFFSMLGRDYVKFFLADGLGHGPEAEKAVLIAGEAFQNTHESDPAEVIRYLNMSVKKTRGLVGTVVIFDLKAKAWKICGVGNIMTRISNHANNRNYTAYNGIIGLNVPSTLNSQHIDYESGQHLIMCSDGLKSKWDPYKYPSIFRYDLSILSTALIKDFSRNTDDVSVAVCKINL